MVKALAFKGDKKIKKRKRPATDADLQDDGSHASKSRALVLSSANDPVADDVNDDTNWVTSEAAGDVAGPIVFVLPTAPFTSLASDAHGKIYASTLENIVEDDPSTAEPHDVRQVWVANRVAGTESLSFKGHHGRYLGCDRFGILGAMSEAISPEESWMVIPVPDAHGTFSLQTTLRDTFVSIDEARKDGTPTIRGDADAIGFTTTLRIRMQARFKPRLKANKEEKANAKISRKELEEAVGRKLEDEEVKKLKRARREGNYHEALLDVKVKSKHDKFA